jgi:hypothetical protein
MFQKYYKKSKTPKKESERKKNPRYFPFRAEMINLGRQKNGP